MLEDEPWQHWVWTAGGCSVHPLFQHSHDEKEYPGSSLPGLDCHSPAIFPVGINNIVITELTAEAWQRADTAQQIRGETFSWSETVRNKRPD